MKVLYVGNFDPFETGGTRRAYEIVRRIHNYGVEPYVIDVKRIPSDPLTRVGALRSLKEIISSIKNVNEAEKLNVDLVVSTSESPSSVILAYQIAKKLNRPWTAVMQSPVIFYYTPASREPIIIDPLWLPQEIYIMNLLIKNIILTVSISCVMESSIRVPYYIVLRPGVGIDPQKYFNINAKDKVYDAIFMARLTPEKGIYDVVKIWKYVVKEYPKRKLAIAGKFKDRKVAQKFYKLIVEYDLLDNIVYLGYLSNRKKVLALKRSRIFVYPSKLDAFPIVIIEALASGLPVVAYDIPSIKFNYPENIVTKVPVGNIKAFVEEVIRLLNNTKISFISYKAKQFASKFRWDNVVKAEVNAYKKLLEYHNSKLFKN